MKKIIVLLAILLSGFYSFAQEHPQLKIKLRSKTIVEQSLPIDSLKTMSLTSHDLRRGKIRFYYEGATSDEGLNRSFMIEDSAGKEIFRAEGSSFKMRAKTLKKLLGSAPLLVYTMAVPSDPAKAAIVRVRRYAIADLHLKTSR